MKNYFSKFMTLFSGVLIAQLISFILIPVLSRIYSPSQFGELSLFIAITGIMTVFFTLKLDEAIMTAKSLDEAYRIVGAIVFNSLRMLIIGLIISIFFILGLIMQIVNTDFSLLFFILLPINFLALAFFNTNTIFFTKSSMYRKVSKANINRALGLNLSQLLFSMIKSFNGLIIGNILGNLLGAFYTIMARNHYKKYINKINFNYIIKKYKNFPVFNLPLNLMTHTSSSLPQLLLLVPFGANNVGIYYLLLKVFNVPTVLVSNVITNLFFQEASNKYNKGEKVLTLYWKTIAILFLIIIIPSIILLIFSPIIISKILGDMWTNGSEIIVWIIIWTISMFIHTPSNKLVIIQQWQKPVFYFNVLLFMIRLIILLHGIANLDFNTTIIYYCVINAIANFVLIIGIGVALMNKEKITNKYER